MNKKTKPITKKTNVSMSMKTKKSKLEKALAIKVARYETLTKKGLDKITILARKGTKDYAIAVDFLSMARNYFLDAQHFKKQGEMLIALAAFSYAHAWLDAGVRAGILDAQGDDQLFTLP